MNKKKSSRKIPELITVSEAAEILNVNPETLRRWDRRGILKALRFGSRRDRRYQKTEILEIAEKGLPKSKK